MTKKMILKSSASTLLVAGMVLNSGSALSAGFEKSLTWSGKAAAQAGAVVGSVSGADSLYFNPAGLAAEGPTATDVSLNFSPTFSKFKGANPVQNAGTVDGKGGFSPVGGALISHKINNQLGLGVGYYVSGGTKSKYENLDYSSAAGGFGALFTSNNINPLVETNLAITELSIGGGYEVMPGLRIGAAWRPTMVAADFSTVQVGTTPPAQGSQNYVANVHINDIKKTKWDGYKIGAQYEAQDKSWGLGANYRSKVDFTADGNQTAEVGSTTLGNSLGIPAAIKAGQTGVAHVSNSLPQQFVLGGFKKATDTLRVSLEYSFTNYSKDKGLVIVGPTGTSSIITQNWKNMHIARAGFEYTGYSMPVRFGYAWTSQVTPSDRARSTFASPGTGHAIAVGSGNSLMANLDLDYALEYSFASGTGHNIPEVATDAEFKSHAYVAHVSANYRF